MSAKADPPTKNSGFAVVFPSGEPAMEVDRCYARGVPESVAEYLSKKVHQKGALRLAEKLA